MFHIKKVKLRFLSLYNFLICFMCSSKVCHITMLFLQKMALPFRYAANKACIRDVAGRFEVSESTHHRMMSRVTSFLLDIAPSIIKFPSDLQKLATDFEQVSIV